jgi:phage gpG-like protein
VSLQTIIDARGLAGPDAILGRLQPLGEAALLEGLGRLIQEQTRRRLEDEKTSPAGAAWKPNWAGTSILYASGALSRSIDYLVQGYQLIVGSGLVYARIHQEGGVIEPKTAEALAFRIAGQFVTAAKVTMPARPYVGVSSENRGEIVDAAVRFIRGRLGL